MPFDFALGQRENLAKILVMATKEGKSVSYLEHARRSRLPHPSPVRVNSQQSTVDSRQWPTCDVLASLHGQHTLRDALALLHGFHQSLQGPGVVPEHSAGHNGRPPDSILLSLVVQCGVRGG